MAQPKGARAKEATRRGAKKAGSPAPKPGPGARLKRTLLTLVGMGLGLLAFIGLGWLPTFEIPGITMTRASFEMEPQFLERLKVPDGFKVNLYAAGLGRARAMAVMPNGDLLVTVPGRRVLRLKADADGDGRADGVETLLDDLKAPHGLLLDEGWLYVAESGDVVRVSYDAAQGRVTGAPERLAAEIPEGGAHWTRTIKKGTDGWFYVSIGSTCNVCVESHPWRAAMVRFKLGGAPELYASGLRNTVGFDWQPGSGALYGVDNGRDWLGDDSPPEEVNLIEKDGFYGWPFFHGDNVADPDLGERGQLHAGRTIKPVHKLTPHSAPLALTFLRHQRAPGYGNAALVAEHGSWNRSSRSGYRVVSLHWQGDGSITERPFLTGFEVDEDVIGRPVDVVEASDGTIYVSDDLSGVVWRIVHEGEGTDREPRQAPASSRH